MLGVFRIYDLELNKAAPSDEGSKINNMRKRNISKHYYEHFCNKNPYNFDIRDQIFIYTLA